MANELEREIKRLSNLKNYKSLSPEELEPIAQKNIIVREFKANPLFADEKEQKLAESRFRNYLENNEIDNASDIDTLKSLIFNEIFEIRIQGELNKLKTDGKYPPDKLIKSLVEVQNQKGSLKIKLGIDKKEEEKDDLSAYQLLHKRVDKYINEHKDEFTLGLGFQCESCGHKNWETFLLYKRIKDFNTIIKHPYFAGRFLFNYEIVKDVKDNKITKQQATRYLMCAGQGKFYKPSADDMKWCEDYIDYLLENWKEISELIKQN